jgi:hypothetical protein
MLNGGYEVVGYVIDPEMRSETQCLIMPPSINLAISMAEFNQVVLGTDLEFGAIRADGTGWNSGRLSWDGIKIISVSAATLTGEAYAPMGDSWFPFTLDLLVKVLARSILRNWREQFLSTERLDKARSHPQLPQWVRFGRDEARCRRPVCLRNRKDLRSLHSGSRRNALKRRDSPPCCSRSRQRDCQRIAAQDHERDQPSDRPFGIGVGADQLGDVADGGGFGLDVPALGGHRGAFQCRAAKVPDSRPLSSARPARAFFWLSIADRAA